MGVKKQLRIAIIGNKGGVGKTTIAINLAGALSRFGPTVLIDGDENGSSLLWATGGGLPFSVVSIDEPPDKIPPAQFYITDSPARPSLEDLAVIAQHSDLLILPTGCDILGMAALQGTVARLSSSQVKATNYRVLLSMVSPQFERDEQDARAHLLEKNIVVFSSRIRRYKAYEIAAGQGVLVWQAKSSDKAKIAWMDFESLANEIIGLLE